MRLCQAVLEVRSLRILGCKQQKLTLAKFYGKGIHWKNTPRIGGDGPARLRTWKTSDHYNEALGFQPKFVHI